MSQIECSHQRPAHPTLAFNLQSWDNYIFPLIRENLVLIALPFTLYGILLLLCGASIYSLIHHRSNRTRPTTLVLSSAILILFCSTTVYTVSNFFSIQGALLASIASVGLEAWAVPLEYGGMDSPFDANVYGPKLGQFPASCAGTGALTINILLGDAIVCWRACVLWQRNRSIMGTCILLLLTTFALGVVDTMYTCSFGLSAWQPDSHADGTGSLYQGVSFGVAATVLSLSTNFFATVAVAFKAWQSRRTLKPYLVMGPMASQVEKLFSLLIESGAIYCTLWVVVLVWQARTYANSVQVEGDFSDIFGIIMKGALVPLIAIYPTIIIVLVALNRSHVENGFMKSSSSRITLGPEALRPPTAVANATVTTCYDSQPRDDTETVLVIGGQEWLCDSGSEGSSTHTAERRKLEEMI